MIKSIGVPYLFSVGWPNMKTTLGERVKLALEGPPKRSQVALAKAAGVHPVSVNDWVHDRTQRIEGAHLLSAAAFLGVSPKWLAQGVGPMRSVSGNEEIGALNESSAEVDGKSARLLIERLAAISAPLRPTLRKNLGNLLVELVEHPSDADLIEQTIADIERFFQPTAVPKAVLVGNLGSGRESLYDQVVRQKPDALASKPPANKGPTRSSNAGKPKL